MRDAARGRTYDDLHEESPAATDAGATRGALEQHRKELTAYCYRMLASPFEAEDAVQETFIRAWRGYDRFEGRAALRSWLYRIATNVCLDMLNGRERRARPMDLGPAGEPIVENLNVAGEVTWLAADPGPGRGDRRGPRDDPARVRRRAAAPAAAAARLPDPLRGAALAGERGRRAARDERRLGEQRAPARAGDARGEQRRRRRDARRSTQADAELLARYVDAFERYDMDALTSLIHEDATQSMPPFDLWLRGRDDIFTWWFGPGSAAAARA